MTRQEHLSNIGKGLIDEKTTETKKHSKNNESGNKRKVGDGILSPAQAYDKQEHVKKAGDCLIKTTETKKHAKNNANDNESKVGDGVLTPTQAYDKGRTLTQNLQQGTAGLHPQRQMDTR